MGISLLKLLNFLDQSHLPQLALPFQAAVLLMQLPLIISNKQPADGVFPQWVMLNKDKPHDWDFSRELSDGSNTDNSFG